ncbi:MAG: GntR family transcriptional regulator [Firmicutes bacterium HGW-Firmicutes-2]|jgi:DNA-binding GntR family transcriptional regulator|nr:MAG: GntR family transcriptional regulator [Firmicutes bacterium HGW-Firmicutes-2]
MAISLKQKAYTIIKSKILNCEYPPSMFLNEEILCNEINASRTPIRDALVRLEQENLVTILPKKGIIVSSLTISEINAIYETRILLEPYILLNYGARITEDILKRMKDSITRMDLDKESLSNEAISDLYVIDDEYHKLLIGLCNNKYLIQCHDHIYAQNYRLRIMSGNQIPERLIASKNEHLKIHNYIIQENYIKASEALKEHLLASKEAAFKVIINSTFPV